MTAGPSTKKKKKKNDGWVGITTGTSELLSVCDWHVGLCSTMHIFFTLLFKRVSDVCMVTFTTSTYIFFTTFILKSILMSWKYTIVYVRNIYTLTINAIYTASTIFTCATSHRTLRDCGRHKLSIIYKASGNYKYTRAFHLCAKTEKL